MSKYIPTKIAKSIYDIDYNELYASGKRIILFDLDNTLISYYEDIPNQKLIEFGKMLLSSGFKVYVLSNNRGKRIGKFLETFPATDSGNLMKKPFAYKIKKFLKNHNITNYSEIIMIGDQLVTDILCANNVGVESILVKSNVPFILSFVILALIISPFSLISKYIFSSFNLYPVIGCVSTI